MKSKKFLCLLALPFLLISCSTDSKNGSKAQSELDSLRNVVEMQKADIEMANTFVALYNTSMDSMLNANNIIMVNEENNATTVHTIKGRIEAANRIIEEQRSKVLELQQKLEKTNTENARKMKEALAFMQKQLDAKDAEIQELNRKLDSKNVDIAKLRSSMVKMESNISKLEEQTKAQEEALVAQNDLLNSGYVAIGTSKDLKAKGLLASKFLGKKKVNVDGIDESKFTKVDIRSYRSVVIPAKKAKVLTSMPADSYKITKNNDNTCTLVITDPGSFWSQTTFLIVSY